MIRTHAFLLPAALLLAMAACSQLPKEAYYEHGSPESLLDVSSEKAELSVASQEAAQKVIHSLGHEKPVRAELHCLKKSTSCNKVEEALRHAGVSLTRVVSSDNSVLFTYEHVMARDCENRYIDNMINPYNLNHPTFGCSVSANSVQMVTDKHEFTSPRLLAYPDAGKTGQAMDLYNAPSKVDLDLKAIATQETLQTSSGSR